MSDQIEMKVNDKNSAISANEAVGKPGTPQARKKRTLKGMHMMALCCCAAPLLLLGPAQKSEMKSMGKMSMDEMMKDCKERHQAAMKSIDQMTKMMESAKQSNDPAKMRVTLDQSQKQLGEMKEHMSMCSKMMNMMEKMQGTGGMGEMMKDRSK
jgi:hypothetical protein